MAAFVPLIGKNLGVKKVPITFRIEGKKRTISTRLARVQIRSCAISDFFPQNAENGVMLSRGKVSSFCPAVSTVMLLRTDRKKQVQSFALRAFFFFAEKRRGCRRRWIIPACRHLYPARSAAP